MTNDQLVKVLAEVKTCAETGSALVLGPGAVHNLWLAIQAIGAAHEPPADARDAARYRWLRDGRGYVPEEEAVHGYEELDQLCDAGITALNRPAPL